MLLQEFEQVLARTVARKSSIRGLYVCAGVLYVHAGGLDVCVGWACHSNLTKIPLIYNVSYFNLGGLCGLFGGG